MFQFARIFRIGHMVVAGLLIALPTLAAQQAQSLGDMSAQVSAASQPNPPWTGPKSGPVAQRGKHVAIIAEDLRNGGILGVAKGVTEAAKILDWELKVYDAGGTSEGRRIAAANALAGKPDGVILIGADATVMRPQLTAFADKNVPIVGWHVGPKAGPLSGSAVAVNVSTNPLEVAAITAMDAVSQSQGKAGVVIFTDSNFEIAMAKANAMAEVIRSCKSCTLLAVKDVAISKSHELMAGVTLDLLARYGTRWTYALAINDLYFDYMVPELIKSGVNTDSIKLLSAGDGSAAAFQRILAGSYQIGTVAEPLNLHGWQLADELNRLFAGKSIDGYIAPVHLVTSQNVHFDGGPMFQFDPDNGYRKIYQKIWEP